MSQKMDLYQEGLLFFSKGKYEEAIDCLNRVIENDKSNANLYLLRARAFNRIGKKNETYENLITASKLGSIRAKNALVKFRGNKAFENFEVEYNKKTTTDNIPAEIEYNYSLILPTQVNSKTLKKLHLFSFYNILTLLIFSLNIIIYYLMFEYFPSDGSQEYFLSWGANYQPLINAGEYWRFFSSVFIHGNLTHLILNMVILIYIGVAVEKIYGNFSFTLIYLASGLLGSLSSFIFYSNVLSVGASGAIFGLYGAFFSALILSKKNLPQKDYSELTQSVMTFLAMNLYYGFSSTGIDNAAHIGGFFTGFILGFILSGKIENRDLKISVSPLAISTLLLIFVGISPFISYQNSITNTTHGNETIIERAITVAEANRLFIENIGIKPLEVFLGKHKGYQYIIAEFMKNFEDFSTNRTLMVYLFTNDKWERVCWLTDLYSIQEAKLVNISGNDYVSFCERSDGNMFGSMSFNLVSIVNLSKFEIRYSGEVNNYDKLDYISPKLSSYPTLLSFLTNEVSESIYIYKNTAEDNDMTLPQNYKKAWRNSNNNLYSKLKRYSNKKFDLTMNEYDFDLVKNIKLKDKRYGSIAKKIENSEYIIYSFFKDDVLGYSKKRGKYFSIWIPETQYEWISELKFLNDYKVVLIDSGGFTKYLIDIKNYTIFRYKGDRWEIGG